MVKRKQLRTSRITGKRLPVGKRLHRIHYSGKPESKKLKVLMREFSNKLSLTIMKDPASGDYKYLIQDRYLRGHSAFHTLKGLKRYLKITGLKIGKTKRFDNQRASGYNLIGSYQRINYGGNQKLLDEFGRKHKLKPEKILSNGSYTRGWYGNNKIHLLNPNYPRVIYPHFWE